METLIIRHLGSDGDQHRFQVWRPDGKSGHETPINAPNTIRVEGRPDSDLSRDLRWYLEQFLDYPFDPNTAVAERVQAALKDWGKQAFQTLFGGNTLLWYHKAYEQGLKHLTVKIASDDPRILAWPWEALNDPQSGTLAHGCRIERQLSELYDPLPLPDNLSRDRIHILMITARPKKQDVNFRALSRPLLELIEQEKLPAQVDILRPPTFKRLREQLKAKPGHYHIVHFDGHGGYGVLSTSNGHQFREGRQGMLCFEDDEGKEKLIDATQLSTLLREYRIPIMVLNACQSAMIDDGAEDAFASVAGALQKAGINGVVAMAYSLYVSGAEVFVPAFYRSLFESGNVSEAVRSGRRAMLQDRGRVCARGKFGLDDWLVPVVYQQDPPELTFAEHAGEVDKTESVPLPAEISEDDNPYGFIGRDNALLALERALRRPPAGILIHGLGGIGKTTLAKGLVRWLADTNGLGEGCFWFSFNDIHSSEYVFNQLVAALFGANAMAAELDQKIQALVQVLKDHPFILVWDNFESVSGIAESHIEALIPEPDRHQLRDFLYQLRGGQTKVIITSRSPETAWLNKPNCYRLPLEGLRGEERWEYCNAIVRDLGLSVDRSDAKLTELLDLLEGHPLMMRAMLVQLGDYSARELAERLRHRLQQTEQDDVQAKLFATLGFVEASLAEVHKPLLIPLGLHERFVDADYLEAMAKSADQALSRPLIDQCLSSLETAGLLHGHGQGIYALHPALSGYLRARSGLSEAERESWQRGFVDIMGSLADAYVAKELHERRPVFYLHGANFHTALAAAETLAMDTDFAALTQALGAYAQNRRDFVAAQRYFEHLAQHHQQRADHEGEAGAYHQLGRIAEEQRDFGAAEQWYLKSLAITEKQGNEHGAALTYHQLGIIAQEQRDLGAAEQWYLKALAIKEKQGNEHGAASTYHQLGIIAQEQRDFGAAEQWYLKSLAITEKQGNEHGAASTYHQLGRIAQEQRDFGAAEQWYLKSLAITEKQGNEHVAASTYHQLGIIAEEQRDFGAAEQWYLKSLAIKEKQGNEHGAASTYHQLGRIAQEQRDFGAAEQWYLKSLAIKEKQGNEHGAASTYHQLGIIAQEQRDFGAAEQWYLKSLAITEKQGNEHGAASTTAQLGLMARAQNRHVESGRLLLDAIKAFANTNAMHSAQQATRDFLTTYKEAPSPDQATLKTLWEKAGLGAFPSLNDD